MFGVCEDRLTIQRVKRVTESWQRAFWDREQILRQWEELLLGLVKEK